MLGSGRSTETKKFASFVRTLSSKLQASSAMFLRPVLVTGTRVRYRMIAQQLNIALLEFHGHGELGGQLLEQGEGFRVRFRELRHARQHLRLAQLFMGIGQLLVERPVVSCVIPHGVGP